MIERCMYHDGSIKRGSIVLLAPSEARADKKRTLSYES